MAGESIVSPPSQAGSSGFGKGGSFARGDNKLGKASQDW